MGRSFALFLLLCWLIAFVGSFVMFAATPPKDFGLTAGMNRVGVFFGWQIAAGVLSVPTWFAGQVFEKKTLLRWLTRVPFIIAALLFFMVLFLILGANLGRPDPSPNPPPQQPTTVPSMPAQPVE